MEHRLKKMSFHYCWVCKLLHTTIISNLKLEILVNANSVCGMACCMVHDVQYPLGSRWPSFMQYDRGPRLKAECLSLWWRLLLNGRGPIWVVKCCVLLCACFTVNILFQHCCCSWMVLVDYQVFFFFLVFPVERSPQWTI